MYNFRSYDQSQGAFRPIIPNELLEPDHPARIIDKVVEMLDLAEIYEFYKQFQGKIDEPSRQLKDVKLSLGHSQGGNPGLFLCAITVVGAPE